MTNKNTVKKQFLFKKTSPNEAIYTKEDGTEQIINFAETADSNAINMVTEYSNIKDFNSQVTLDIKLKDGKQVLKAFDFMLSQSGKFHDSSRLGAKYFGYTYMTPDEWQTLSALEALKLHHQLAKGNEANISDYLSEYVDGEFAINIELGQLPNTLK